MSNGDVGWSLKSTIVEATWIGEGVRDKEGKGNEKIDEEGKRNQNQRRMDELD
jgi:hypothetical protein